jgi:lipid-binding SYLF domain-containing protein
MQAVRRTTKRWAFAASFLVALVGVARSSFAGDEHMVREARETVAHFQRVDPGITRFVTNAAGYAVFPGVGKGGYWVGGAHGTGVLFEGGVPTGKVTLNQISVGPQAGGQEYAEVIFFESPRALAEFKRGKVAFSAQASAVALSSGAAAVAKYDRGVAIFTSMKGGLMVEASVGGQKFSFEPFAPPR